MVRLICIGKITSKAIKELVEKYEKRIQNYSKFEIIEIGETTTKDIKVNILKESKAIKKKFKNNIRIYFDFLAEPITSKKFSKIIENARDSSKTIDFVIGGSDGITDELKKDFDMTISFGNVTFPHQLFRVLATEQIYRGLSIINNSKYHK